MGTLVVGIMVVGTLVVGTTVVGALVVGATVVFIIGGLPGVLVSFRIVFVRVSVVDSTGEVMDTVASKIVMVNKAVLVGEGVLLYIPDGVIVAVGGGRVIHLDANQNKPSTASNPIVPSTARHALLKTLTALPSGFVSEPENVAWRPASSMSLINSWAVGCLSRGSFANALRSARAAPSPRLAASLPG